MGLTFLIELFTQVHYKKILSDAPPLYREIFRAQWMEESQHAVLDELESGREDARLTPAERQVAVTHLIELVGAVNQLLEMQAAADATYFASSCQRELSRRESNVLRAAFLNAYQYQRIFSGVNETAFVRGLGELI